MPSSLSLSMTSAGPWGRSKDVVMVATPVIAGGDVRTVRLRMSVIRAFSDVTSRSTRFPLMPFVPTTKPRAMNVDSASRASTRSSCTSPLVPSTTAR